MSIRFALLLLIAVVFSAPGCALFKSGEYAEVVQANSPAPAQVMADAAVTVVHGGPDELLLDRKDLGDFGKVSISLAYADVTIVAGVATRKGTLRVQRLKGGENCKVYLHESKTIFELTETPPVETATASLSATAKRLFSRTSVPSTGRCRFAVELGLREASQLNVDLKRGAILLEQWDQPTSLKLDWGDIDVGTVGALDVKCGRCTLAGEGVAGPLRFTIESGNVGLSGLVGAVDGKTLGDTILKWSKVKAGAAVKLVSQSGDVILTFPRGVPLDMQLKAPRGDVYIQKDHPENNGIPVSVTAEIGNVKLYSSN